MTRLLPFEHAFAAFIENQFPAILEEARATHRNTADRSQFAVLRATQHLLHELEAPEVIERDPEAATEYLSVLHAAYRFWLAGRLVCSVSHDALEAALRDPPAEGPVRIPQGACYLQLPERWFWAQIGSAEPFEPVDGLFLIAGLEERDITVITVLGLRADRPGFSQITVITTPTDLATASTSARKPPFAPIMDGGAAAGLHSLITSAEVLHLAHLGLAVTAAEPLETGGRGVSPT